jgi:hypothetical protein
MSETTTSRGHTFRAERTEEEVVLRFPSLSRLMRAFLPDEAVKHMQNAQREQLLAMRVVLDAAIERLEKAQHEGESLGPRRTEIRVE